MKDIKPGDYFLLPYMGKRIYLLVRAVKPWEHGGGHWVVRRHNDTVESIIFLSSCHRCPRSVVLRILKRKTLPRLK